LTPQLRWLRELDPACLLASWAYPDAVGVTALARLAKLRVPIVIKAHGSDLNVHAASSPLAAVQLRWAAQQARAFVCVSEALRAQAIALGVPKGRTVVIRNGVDVELFRRMPRQQACALTGLAAQRKALLFVGNVLESKGARELMAAFGSLAQERTDLDLVVVGEGPYAAELRQAAAAGGLQERVKLIGRVPHEQLTPWFNAAELVCLPSYAEGLPNVLLEAMACGTPCVASRVGGIPEVVTAQAGLLVPPKDADALTAALRLALDRSWDREALARGAARFSWDANVQAMSELLDDWQST
jgi:glycosyltransferase involved in cell wall biosynthesis